VAPRSRSACSANKTGQVAAPALIASATVVVGDGGGFLLLGVIVAAATLGAAKSR